MLSKRLEWLPILGVGVLVWSVLLAFDPLTPMVRSFVIPKLFAFFASCAFLAFTLLLQSDLTQLWWRPNFPHDLLRLGLLWLGWLGLTAVGGTYPLRSWLGSYQWQLGVTTQSLLWVSSWLVFLAVRNTKTLLVLWQMILWSSLPILSYATLQYLQLEPVTWYRWGDAGVVMATLGNENHLGAYLAMLLPLTLAKFLNSPMTVRRVGWGLLLSWQIFILSGTNAVGAWLAATLACALVCWWHWRFVWWHAIVAVGLLLLLSAGTTGWVASKGDEIGEWLRQQGVTREVRPFTWATGWGAVAAHPWVGWGLSSFDLTQARYASPKFREYIFPIERLMDRVHNLWLELLIETGVIGLGLWLAILSFTFYSVLRRINLLGSEARSATLSGVAAIVSYLLYQVVNPSELGTFSFFFVMLGLVLGGVYIPTNLPTAKNSFWLRGFLGLTCCSAVVGMGYALWQWMWIG